MRERRVRGPYTLRDRRYVAQWVIENYPHEQVFYNLRLGGVPSEVAARYPGIDVNRMARVYKKTCDAVVVTKTELILIEGELRRPLLALGELIIYRDLISTTPELKLWSHFPIRTVLLCPVEDPSLDMALATHKIEKAVFKPPWVEQYLKEVMK